MDEKELLNFNYALLSKNQIQSERMIKQMIRDLALNKTEPSEVEKYTDKYLDTVSYLEVTKTINKELMSLEMQKIHGFHYNGHSQVILNEMDEDEEINGSGKEENDEDMSLGGGDDYEQNYYEEDDFVEEYNDKEEVF